MWKFRNFLGSTHAIRFVPAHESYFAGKLEDFEYPEEAIKAYNEALRALAKELNVPVVDVHAAYPAYAARHNTTVAEMLPDGMHPGELGHQLIAELLVPVIRDALR